ncbi:hypothetical protein FBQ97_13370 [Acidobacteria bacterium ACD]|nr:MAG: hypothetical protein EDX89_02695 [Acidobacteriota bacterium]MCE7957282.1 hypothetical protein [Acidobacteria bacterium ACB2]MDL1950787.1 hypothetical protein [Acidobacteria bacterium ACD]
MTGRIPLVLLTVSWSSFAMPSVARVAPPRPIEGVRTSAHVTFDAAARSYCYSLAFESPASNEIPVSTIDLDVTLDPGWRGPSAEGLPSVTRDYLSFDRRASSDDAVLGERAVPPLSPGETSAGAPSFPVPDLDAGVYWILACADAPGLVPELDETNNCLTLRADVAAVVRQSASAPPVCSAAVAAPGGLWPPNHQMREVRVDGLADPDGDAVTVTVTGVTQDEPVHGLDDGTSFDSTRP